MWIAYDATLPEHAAPLPLHAFPGRAPIRKPDLAPRTWQWALLGAAIALVLGEAAVIAAVLIAQYHVLGS